VYELEITRPDGARRRLLLTATPQFDSQGTFAGAFAIFRDITERKEMEDKLRHEVEKMNALHMIDQAMATLDLQACLRVIVQRARALFDTDMVAILLQEGNFLRLVAEEGLENSQTEILVPIDRGLTGWSYSSRQSVLVPDVRNDERYLIFDNRTRAEMVAPLIAQDECIGVLNAESARLNAFTFADLEMLESLATRAATAIRNARLHAAEQSERRFAETLRDVGYALTSKLDPDAVLDQLLDLVARVVPYDTASVLFVENEMVCIKRQRGFEQFGQAQEAADFHARLKDLPSLAKAAETGRPHIVPDTRSDPDWVRLELGDHILSCIVAPISVRGQLLGFLSLDKATPNFYDAETADRLAIFAAQAGLALENARLYAEQRRLAITDELTGLFNRRYWIELAEREYARARRRQSPLSVTMIDMNGFKKINDTYGHAMGDEVLRRAAETIKSSVRSVDMAARLGGDEFVVLLPDCGISDVRKVTARLEQQIKELRVPVPDGKIGLSFSVGSATLDPAAEETLDSLLIRADAKMYRTKAQSNGQSHKFKSRRNISGGNGHSPGDEQVAGIAVELFQPYRATRNA
jgi:diguanylate cyclase (GGDEF)-like protein